MQPLTDAQRQLAATNIRLVYAVSNRLWHRASRIQRCGWDIDDVVQTGSIGLLKAAVQFREGRGMKFSSFACRLIGREISAASERRIVRPFGSLPDFPAELPARELDQGHQANVEQMVASIGRLAIEDNRIVEMCFGSPEPVTVLARRRRMSLSTVIEQRDSILERFRSGIPWR